MPDVPTITEIAYRTWHINECGMDSMYLLEGSEEAQVARTCRDILAGGVIGVYRMTGDFCGEHLEVREGNVTIQYFP